MEKKSRTILYLLLGIIVVGLTVFFVFFYKATVVINPNPNTAKIELAGNVISATTKNKVKPGQYNLKISQGGYISYEKTINLKVNQKLNIDVELKQQPQTQKITDFPTKFTTLTSDQKSLLYISNEGKTAYIIYDVVSNNRTKPTAITPDVFGDVNQLIWHPGKRLAIYKTNDKHTGLYDFGRYDLINQEMTDWGLGIGDVAFSNDGGKIVYFYAPDTGEKSLIRADKDNNNRERLLDLAGYNLNDPEVRWSADSKYVLLITDKIYLVDMYFKSITELPVENIDDAIFTPDSQNIIYEQNSSLSLCDLKGENQKPIAQNTKIIKTTWLDDTKLLCAFRDQNQLSDSLKSIDIYSQQETNYDYNKELPMNIFNPLLTDTKNEILFESNGFEYLLELVDTQY